MDNCITFLYTDYNVPLLKLCKTNIYYYTGSAMHARIRLLYLLNCSIVRNLSLGLLYHFNKFALLLSRTF